MSTLPLKVVDSYRGLLPQQSLDVKLNIVNARKPKFLALFFRTLPAFIIVLWFRKERKIFLNLGGSGDLQAEEW